MSSETHVNGGAKLLTASVVMTLGVGGALLFRQDPADVPRPEAASAELLVRRSNGPPAVSVDPFASAAPSPFAAAAGFAAPQQAILSGSAPHASASASLGTGAATGRSGAQFSGSIDPFRVEGARASTQGRLTADYGRSPSPAGVGPAPGSPFGPAGSTAPPYMPPHMFVDPTSESERTPLNNITSRAELPPEYPGASATPAALSVPAGKAAPAADLTPLSSAPTMSPSAASLRPPFMNAGTTVGPATPQPTRQDASTRPTMPTLHADSGASSAPTPALPPQAEPRRKNASDRRHKVRDGDTLASLAAAYYGDAERYPAIYEANRAVLSNPDVLTIGSYLIIPSADEAAATSMTAAGAAAPPAARLVPRVQIRPLGE